MRQSNTFARSNVIGNDEAALKLDDGIMHKPIVRDEKKRIITIKRIEEVREVKQILKII